MKGIIVTEYVTVTANQSSGLYNDMGLAGFEPATSSARGWHHTKLDNNPNIESNYHALL